MAANCMDIVKNLQGLGFTQTEIAEKVGVTFHSAHRWSKATKISASNFGKLRRLYIRANAPKYNDLEKFDTVELVRALRMRGWEVKLTSL
jgi:hypothetical protein